MSSCNAEFNKGVQNPPPFGDTTLTKVFVGGLAWETQTETMKTHFQQFGEILEAVIISDKVTGRSKGYGFVTFKEAEAAKKACEDAAPMINGRQANCNLASLGARRSRASTPQPGSTNNDNDNNGGVLRSAATTTTPNGDAMPWYYPTGTAAATRPLGHHQYQTHHQAAIPFHAYGYSPAYYADVAYNPKLGYSGSYVNGQYSQLYPAQGVMATNTVLPVYPYFHFHPSQTVGVPTQLIPPNTAAPLTTIPGGYNSTKPPPMAPNAGMNVQQKVAVRDA